MAIGPHLEYNAFMIDAQKIAGLLDQISAKVGEWNTLQSEAQSYRERIAAKKAELADYEQVQTILRANIAELPEQLITYVESLVTDALRGVFGKNERFHIEFQDQRQNPSLEFRIIDDDNGIETDVKTANGGGYVCFISVILRLIMIRLSRGTLRQCVIPRRNLWEICRRNIKSRQSHLSVNYRIDSVSKL